MIDWTEHMISGARACVVMSVALGVMLGVPLGIGNAADANAGNQNSADQYAKRGNCTGCPPIREMKHPGHRNKPRHAKQTQQAKHAPPKKQAKDDGPDIPLPEKCKYAMPDEPGSEALKIECNKAGYPTPHWPTRGATAAEPEPTLDSESFNDKRRALERQLMQSEHDKAQGGPPGCSGSSSAEEDVLSGCHY